MINVLINATTIVGDKDTHSAIEFIQAAESKSAPRITWHYAVSRTVARELLAIGPNLRSAYFFEHSPANSKSDRKRLKAIEENIDADVVFTVSGPAYVRFDVPHICGVADGWVTDSILKALRSASGVREMAADFARSVYKGYWFSKADEWMVEASNAKQGLIERLRLPGKDIVILPTRSQDRYEALEREIIALGESTGDASVERGLQ
ncbi:MAG: hypothetical protein V3R53_01225 [Gammaproteobacteria bacterium]